MERSRRLPFFIAVVGSACWLLLFYFRFSLVPADWWTARDDAVITLSHARNLAEFGSIGVSPGDRVEGFSSPLQFAIAAAAFRLAPLGYESFLMLFLAATVAAMGALVTLVTYFASRAFGNARVRSARMAIVLCLLVALTSLATWTTSGWLVSGMENPLVVVAGLGVLVFVLSPSSRPANTAGALTALVVLGMARVEFAAFVVPLVAAVAFVQSEKAVPPQRRLVFVLTWVVPLASLAFLHLGRRLYFGSWLPNTAVVQGRAQGWDQIFLFACLGGAFVAVLLQTLMARVGDRHRLVAWAKAGSPVVFVALMGAAVWMTASGRSKGSLTQLVLLPSFLLLAAALVVLARLVAVVDRSQWTPNFVFAGVGLIPVGQFLVMGPARLEDFRVASIAIPFLATWVAVMTTKLVALGWPAGNRSASEGSREVGWMLLPVGLLLSGGLLWTRSQDVPRDLPWGISGTEDILAVADSVRDVELDGGGLPIVANPDLGKLSFAKRSLVVDLGLLGDPMLTQLSVKRPDLIVTYLNEVAAPDVVESHGGWSCGYSAWLQSEHFRSGWRLSDDRWLDGKLVDATCALGGRTAIWRRTNADAEYALTREVAKSRRPESVVRLALEECSSRGVDPFRCQYVRRAVQRNAHVLRNRGELDDVIAVLESSPSAELDIRLVSRGSNWGSEAFREFVELAEQRRALTSRA